MIACYDFFNIYIMGVIEMSLQFYFLIKILGKKRWTPVYFPVVVCAAIICHFISVGTIVGFLVLILWFTVCGTFVCHVDIKSSLLYAALTTEIMLLCNRTANSLVSLLCPFLPAVFRDMDGITFTLASQTAALLLTGICYYAVYRYFAGDVFHSLYGTAEMQQMFLVFIPVAMIFMLTRYVNTLQFDIQYVLGADEEMSEYLFSYWQLLVMNLLGLVSLFCILFSYKKLQQNFCLSTELSLLEQEERSLNQYVEEAKTRYDRTKAFRHDVRNHIAVVKKLVQSGKMEAAVRYMEDMEDMEENMSFPVSTNNPVVDILLGNKLGIAESTGIRTECSLLLPYPGSLRDIDLCIVLSNALDNAIQACKSLDAGVDKYIHISGRIQGDFLMMEIENSCHGKGVVKKGTGLANVKKVAEKYGGAMSIETRMNVFVLHVLLIIPQHPKDII